MATDREYLKRLQTGQFTSENLASNAVGEIVELHKRTRSFVKIGSENAATNVAETPLGRVYRKSKLHAASLTTATTNIAGNNSDYLVLTVYKRTSAGASQTALVSWNTHLGATGSLTLSVPATGTLTSTVADRDIAAGSVLSYALVKAGNGKALDPGSAIDLDLEEI